MVRRIVIKWNVISPNFCDGAVTLDEWEDEFDIINTPFRTTVMPCSIEKGVSSLKSIPKDIVTEEIDAEIRTMMSCFFAGVCGEYSIYSWSNLHEGE